MKTTVLTYHPLCRNGLLRLLLLLLVFGVMPAQAQIIGGNVYGGGEKGVVSGNSFVTVKGGKIGSIIGNASVNGNIYGGGNAGNLLGHTTVNLLGGNIFGGVFGGAQQADVLKYTFVNIDGTHQLRDLTVNRVYGGNDVSGVIGAGLTDDETVPIHSDSLNVNTIDKTWQSYIWTRPENNAAPDTLDIFIGQMFGGGNGDYDYTTGTAETNPYYGKTAPTVAKTYLQIDGGTYGYVFAGGNNATVTENTVISVNDSSEITTATSHLDLTAMSPITNIDPNNPVDLRLLSMGLNLSTFKTGHHFNRIFGGNNKADMTIMPSWDLEKGDVINLYSGGNEGRMTHNKGILLEIKATSKIIAENVYGGCRKADVHPLNGTNEVASQNIQIEGYNFPPGFSARTLVRGGTITNVYGGNDISGKVYGGNAVGVYTSITGDVYGGGNGSYAYTDNAALKDDLIWGDFYYDPGSSSIDSLFAHRPNAEQVSLRLKGESATNRTIIGGSVYVGGNSATLATTKTNPTVELKIGSHVIADNVYLGNNGEHMVDASETGVLKTYSGSVTDDDTNSHDFSTLTLTDPVTFAKYMDGCAMTVRPSVVFDNIANNDPATYENYTSFFGSFFGGGNVGSMVMPGKVTLNFDKQVVIFNKLVGGCNNANIAATMYNAAYNGGVIGSAAEQAENGYQNTDGSIKDRIEMNLAGVKLAPLRWKVQEKSPQPTVGDDLTNLNLATMDSLGVVTMATGTAQADVTYYEYLDVDGGVCTTTGLQPTLEYNVFNTSGQPILQLNASSLATGTSSADDKARRLIGANVYGACYNSGHVNGNIVINLNKTIHDRDHLFDEITATEHLDGNESYNITARHTGVILNEQAMDVSTLSLAVLGAGYGKDSEVWGSATVNLNKGFTFQTYGGGQQGIVGKNSDLTYDAKYSTFSNLKGTIPGVAVGASGDSEDMAEAVFIYGGSYEGTILGNTQANLGNGRVYNSIAGSCTANIYGHSEMYMGRNTSNDSDKGFPWVIDDVYGGNDVAGQIMGTADFKERVRTGTLPMVYGYNASTNPSPTVMQANAYVEYQQGHVRSIFGGSCGDFDYTSDDSDYKAYADFVTGKGPLFIENAFVNFSPLVNISNNNVLHVYGAGQGHKDGDYKDMMQNRSYVLVDVPQYWDTFQNTEVFGGGENGGVGMGVPQVTAAANASGVEASAVIDLVHGKISAAYGGSYSQGMTRRTIVNVPKTNDNSSTIVLDNIFGGAYGEDPLKPCDVYQSIVNYNSGDARVNGAIYGGNNSADRTLYTQVNINAPVKQSNGYDGYAYGAGKGEDSWAQYTEVNLNDGASVWEVYGGGNAGKVLNQQSVAKWAANEEAEGHTLDLTLGGDYTSAEDDNFLANALAYTTHLYTDLNGQYETYAPKYNTNVIINKGAYVGNYAYGGGYGADAVVSGSTYVELNGGTVKKDIYAAGSSGSVEDLYKCGSTGDKGFTASTTAYVRGGTARNVYGGGWEGAVGYHNTGTTAIDEDILGETHVVIGRTVCGNDSGLDFYDGIPAVLRNAYGAGEGGVVFGTSNLTLYNGYIGYSYNAEGTDEPSTSDFDERYEEKIGDDTYDDGNGYGNNTRLKEAGNIFGSGYADYSNTDIANVTLYGGIVRNSVYGGGEIGTVGRGLSNGTIHKGGETHVGMYKGRVMHDVFGGGRGYDNLNRVSEIGTSGYVFGTTDVAIYGGEVGTKEGVADGYGNVFGGGNIGFVYSANGTKDSDGFYYYNNKLTEDCKVVIAPACKVTSEEIVTLNGHTYSKCQFVPAVDLNYLKNKNADSRWNQLDGTGVVIHNAVFAGGNVSTGSDQVHANAVTVFGNATATLYDIFNRDLITIGTENVGGIYGDGNLTLVDGYRELNVSNYGTDYYGMSQSITLEEYNNLSDRERAYFELKYKCKVTYHSDKLDRDFTTTSTITAEEYATLGDEQSYWEQAGVCSIYAGRLLNTIQRADFCGIFGSRMVLQGARDRVPEVVDYSNYTINRVGEVSLNKSTSQAGDTGDDATHGCYFGIYNMVNYLGALTSDVDFGSTRTTDQSNSQYAANGESYYKWKEDHIGQRSRNNGTAAHKVALASGVFLEITTEESTKDNKVWGPITGVCQLDLINVNTGLGGGYVYAKNVHGTRSSSGNDHTILSAYNLAGYGHEKAVTNKIYTYSTSDLKAMETSGNFIHNVKQIVDDCYPIGGSYTGSNASPAHYWFIKGEVYVYDQYISAYTGSASAYSESINLPLTITPAANGELVLVDVQPNLYAYYDDNQQKISDPIVVNNITYDLNEPITYWDWSLLSAADQAHFVSETYVTSEECTAGNESIPAGTVLLQSEYDSYKNATIKNASGEPVAFDEVFHKTNHISHDTGYALTFEMSNPKIWDRYYTPITGTSIDKKITTAAYNATSSKSSYLGGPTYYLNNSTGGVFGQRDYEVGDIISDAVHATYEAIDYKPTKNQATVVQAYVATGEVTYTLDGTEHHVYKGSKISATDYAQLTAEQKAMFDVANVCTSTIDIGNNEYVFYGDLLTASEISSKKAAYVTYLTGNGMTQAEAQTQADNAFAASVSNAWYCTVAGKYGGAYYEPNRNYGAIDVWSSMSEADRQNFTFNYDAFDVLIDPDYEHKPDNYDGYQSDGTTPLQNLYSAHEIIDYQATYNGSQDLTYTDENSSKHTIQVGATIEREAYEDIPNEKRHYTSITISQTGDYYIVKQAFIRGETPYMVGSVITAEQYGNLDSDQKQNVELKSFSSTGTFYYCRESYVVGEKGEGAAVRDIAGTTYNTDGTVPVGAIIAQGTTEDAAYTFTNLVNKQSDFTIHGKIPVETSTLYVSRLSNIKDLNEDKVITVIYNYTYEESDGSGNNVEQITEQHVVNIHIQFKTGVPVISELEKPNIVLPSSTVGLKQPNVTPGAFEIIGGGWELFTNKDDAEQHVNGVPYYNNQTPMYWYQDGYYVAYYAKSYLGKTYSNAVQFSVANYHDLDDVMADTEHHMYIDYDPKKLKRDAKIYINDYSDDNKNGLDLLKGLVDLTYDKDAAKTSYGALATPENISGGSNLEFILRTNIDHTDTWEPIANTNEECFGGNFHGDGHYISGLKNSLFNHLCGNVYNLGVMGSFTSAGIAETGDGYVENCWVSTSSTAGKTSKPVFGEPTNITTERPYRIVNCYYMEQDDATNKYTNHSGTYGKPTCKPEKDFYNGTVAYNLNGFYLYKRYSDGRQLTTDVADPSLYSLGYVEGRYADGDFRFANGTIPDQNDSRWYEGTYYTYTPDDYLFFGQMLTYGYTTREHQSVPSPIYKENTRLPGIDNVKNNRVYRAPAYYGSKTLDVAHFNANANLAAYSADKTREAYPGMTAIDFYGHEDDGIQADTEKYQKGMNNGLFYQPLLDDPGLNSIVNRDETQNLLVYSSSTESGGVLINYFVNMDDNDKSQCEPSFVDYYDNDNRYRRVAMAPTSNIHGHWVSEQLVAETDHLLVDKQDFNCPIQYTFTENCRMWYQRTPDNYVDRTKGWEAISIPFAAELVTTQDKGELTHFYQGSTIGHEYWLRELNPLGSIEQKKDADNQPVEGVYTADFDMIAAGTNEKNYTNTFLWDYYYSKDSYKDLNSDEYQKQYYSRDYLRSLYPVTNYPYSKAGTPYIIGLPGETYYEFDLSGSWKPVKRYQNATIASPGKQSVTFASIVGATIDVSDDEMEEVTVDDYTFKPNYLNKEIAAGSNFYTMNDSGSSFEKVSQSIATTVDAFRPYFTSAPSGTRGTVEQIEFSLSDSDDGFEVHGDPTKEELNGGLHIWSKKDKIYVKSTLSFTEDLRVVTPAGVTVASFAVKSGQTVEVQADFSGMYIVHTLDGKYTKKVAVRKK